MDIRFDAASQGRAPVAAPAPAPLPDEAPWARAWAHERQQAAAGANTPAPAGVGEQRVAWRDASVSSTWLAPVRAREAQAPGEDRQALPSRDLQTPGQPAPHGTAGAHHADSAGTDLLFMPAVQPLAMPPAALWAGPGPALPATADATPPVTPTPPGPASTQEAPAIAPPTPGLRTGAPGSASVAAAPRTAPPRRPAEAQPFAPTNLQVTQGEDGPAVWLRDARLGTGGQAAARVQQALAALGWPHALRPTAVYLNGRLLDDRPLHDRTGGPAATSRTLPPQARPDTALMSKCGSATLLIPPQGAAGSAGLGAYLPKEDPHGH
jgi:hypothetical protein